MNESRQSGQILLITLLVLVVLITIGLALIGRVRIDTTMTTDIEESLRAFSAAEAGVEEALKSGVVRSQPVQLSDVPASYTTQINTINAATSYYKFPRVLSQGEVETFWLINHDENQTRQEIPTYTRDRITLCWRGKQGETPALSIALMYKRGAQYLVARAAIDPNRDRDNNFSAPDSFGSGCGQPNVFIKEIRFSDFSPSINPTTDILIFIRLRSFYADAFLFVDGGGFSLPNQGNVIISTGTTGSGVARKIVVVRPFRAPRGIFDAAIISQTSFSK